MKKTKMKKILIHCILIAGIGVAILPFFWMITTAFKTQGESVQMPPVWFPATWNLDAFKENQRIIAGNAQFTGIAAGRGVRFTTGLLLLGKGLGMRETPIRPHS